MDDSDAPAYRDVAKHKQIRSYANPSGSLHVIDPDDGSDEWLLVADGEHIDLTKRIPASVSDVSAGDKLWAIPQNWAEKVHVSADMIDYGIFAIDDGEQYAKVSIPTNDHVVDAWYRVKTVGTELQAQTVKSLASRYEVDEAVTELEVSGYHDDARALRRVAERWHEMIDHKERAEEWVTGEGMEMLGGPGDTPVNADRNWVVEFHKDYIFRPKDVLRKSDVRDVPFGEDILVEILRENDLIPGHYKFEIEVV